MAVKSTVVAVGTSATRLDTATKTDTRHGSSAAPYNNGAATVFLGGSDVTTSTGVPMPAGTWGPGVELEGDEGLYGVVASGSVNVIVLEAGV